MAYDEDLAERVRETLAGEVGVSEKKMFGGLAFLVDGAMSVSASGSGGLLVRADPASSADLLRESHVTPMVMRGRPMAGWLRVGPDAIASDEDLARWVQLGVDQARSARNVS